MLSCWFCGTSTQLGIENWEWRFVWSGYRLVSCFQILCADSRSVPVCPCCGVPVAFCEAFLWVYVICEWWLVLWQLGLICNIDMYGQMHAPGKLSFSLFGEFISWRWWIWQKALCFLLLILTLSSSDVVKFDQNLKILSHIYL